ncbi:MAG: transposase [Desulfobacteraceae bacterium]
MDRLQESAEVEAILRSGARFCQKMIILSAHEKGESTTVATRRIGPGLVFGRVWEQRGCQSELETLLGERRFSKDHRPDLKQMVVGGVLDNKGRPVCCEMWPDSTADVKTPVPVVDRLRGRFGIDRVCIVADRGMISKESIEELKSEERGWDYILGVRMRMVKEVKKEVLARAGRYQLVHLPGTNKKAPSPLKVKEVKLEERRYTIYYNEERARKDHSDREAIIAALEHKVKRGDELLVGNKGYRKFLKSKGKDKGFEIDPEKVKEDARHDGKWVLRTSLDHLDASEVALKYKQLWMVEQIFRSAKSLLETRLVYHKRDENIRGHVFCSFLVLVLMKELHDRLEAKGYLLEWADILRDLDRLQEVEIEQEGKRFLLRTQTRGTCGKVFQAAGVALPTALRQVEAEKLHL